MGAGDCPQETEAKLLQEALKHGLGFSESQLFSAIKHLVKEFGSLEDAPAWIRQDNFTVLVNYILDNEDMQLLYPSSEGAPVSTEQVQKSGSVQKERDCKPPPLSKEVPNGSLSARNARSRKDGSSVDRVDQSAQNSCSRRDDSSVDKVDQQKGPSPQQKGRLDRQAVRLHFRDKILSNCVNKNQGSADYEMNEARSLTAQMAQTNAGDSSGQSITPKKARSLLDQAEHLSPMVPKVIPLQRLNAQPRNEDQGTAKKRGQGMNGPVSIAHKKGKISEPEVKDRWEKRTSMPSGCQDLATGPQSCQDRSTHFSCTSSIGNRKPTGQSQADNEVFQTEVVTKPSAERKASANGNCATLERPRVFVDLDRSDDIPSTSCKMKNKESSCSINKGKTCRAEVLLSVGEQKASCSSLIKSEEEVGQDCAPHVVEGLFLQQLESSLKEGNCQGALEIVKAWKVKGQKVGTMQMKANASEGEGQELIPDVPGRKKGFLVSLDISRGLEKLPISCVNEYNTNILPENFLYVTRSVIRQAAYVDISFSRIGDLHCSCSDDCLRSSEACKCTDSTRGEYAYDENGRLIERLAIGFVSGCATIHGDFITECCDKCRCSMNCGNRIVQRGIRKKLQVFMTPKKGWGVRALEKIPARSFVFEYLGEIATNSEQYDRNREYAKNGVYTYTMNLDADLDMEQKHFKDGLNDHEALVLDATVFGNVSRFVNHRCIDANLFMRPVQIETRDTHYYHAALFAARDIQEMEELTWDYGIDFDDDKHLLKAFKCYCQSSFCRDRVSRLDKGRKGKLVKSSRSKQKQER